MSTERAKFDDQINPDIVTDANAKRVVVYGIPNCSTVKTARKALDDARTLVEFKDVRGQNMGLEDWEYLEKKVGWDALVNRKSKAWRELDDASKANLDRDGAIKLLIAHPTLMKRPAIDHGDVVTIGWTDDVKVQLGLA